MPAIEPKGPQIQIRDLRKAYGLTIPALCERISQQEGIDRAPDPDSISNIELGHKPASVQLLTAWAKALGVQPLDVYQPPVAAKPRRRQGRVA